MLKKRILGLDVGSRTVGVSISDWMGWTAQPLETIRIHEEQKDLGLDRLFELIQTHEVGEIVIGLPKNMNNTLGPRAESAQRYGEAIAQRDPELRIVYQDERLTTSQAERMLISGNVSRAKRKQVIDTVAAVLILQNYLDTQQH